jgi:thiol:disulfide interchange protein
MKCTKCGYEFKEGLFCPECGTKYDEAEAKRIEVEKQEIEKKRKVEEKEKRDLEIEKTKVEQERLAVEKAAREAELLRQQNEKARIEQEAEKKRKVEEKEKRDLEIEKTKVEQERLAVEKATREAELLRQQNEKARIEQENKAKMEEQEKKHQEELTRTFNGVLYNSIDEMNLAKAKYGEQVELAKKEKKTNAKVVCSLILSIATYPLVMTGLLWFPSLIVSIVLGVKALKDTPSKKRLLIASFVINGIFILICVLAIVLSFI